MKKFSKIMESTVSISDSEVAISIAGLWNFLVYDLGMRKIVDDMLSPYSDVINFNSDDNYQYPLSLLFNTGKFPDIKLYGDKYWSPKINKINQVRVNGLWHPVNKLNTNPFDQADLLVDILKNMNKLDEVKNIVGNTRALKIYLRDFFNQNDIPSLMKQFGLKLSNYTTHNRTNSAIGEKAESEVADYLENQGYEVLYRGGDGDPIDMAYGCDIIISKDNKIETVQVKTKEISAIEASKKSNYSSIDLFYWSDNGNVGRVGGEDVSTLF
jgi:hypothetical protein